MLAQLNTLNQLTSESITIDKPLFKIGRDPTNDKQLSDIKVSSFHLQIQYDQMQFTIMDNSSNGTFINGQRIGKGNKVIIQNGDILNILPVDRLQTNQIISFQFFTDKSKDSRLHSDQIQSENQPNHKQSKEQSNDDIIAKLNDHNQYLNDMANELQCNICHDYLFEAVTNNPCNHHFCGACLSNWIEQNNDCPNCRIKIQSIMVARMMNNLVEKWLKNNPSQIKQDSQINKMKQENLIYKNPNYYLNFQEEFKKKQYQKLLQEDDPGEFISNDEDFDENDPDHEQNEIPNPINFFAFQPLNLPPQQIQPIQACKSCNGQVWKQYQCTDNQIHIGCSSCGRLMPKRLLDDEENEQQQMMCCICKVYDCKFYYGDCIKANQNKLILVKDINNFIQIPHNFINEIEYNRILNHLQGRQHSIIFDFMMEHYISKGDFYFQQNKATFNFPLQDINVKITPNTPVCWQCHRKLINFIIFRYVQCWKYDEALFSSPDCFYGVNCRTQHRNKYHANKYNHACEQNKFD